MLYKPLDSAKRPLRHRGTDGSTIPIGYGTSSTTAPQFFLPEGKEYDSNFIKVLVSSSYINMESFIQAAECRMITEMRNPYENAYDWNSWTYVVSQRRKSTPFLFAANYLTINVTTGGRKV
jgi:hypothetical protein